MLTILKSVKSYLLIIHLKKLLRENTIYNFFPFEKIHLIKKKIIRIRNILFRWKKKKKLSSHIFIRMSSSMASPYAL